MQTTIEIGTAEIVVATLMEKLLRNDKNIPSIQLWKHTTGGKRCWRVHIYHTFYWRGTSSGVLTCTGLPWVSVAPAYSVSETGSRTATSNTPSKVSGYISQVTSIANKLPHCLSSAQNTEKYLVFETKSTESIKQSYRVFRFNWFRSLARWSYESLCSDITVM